MSQAMRRFVDLCLLYLGIIVATIFWAIIQDIAGAQGLFSLAPYLVSSTFGVIIVAIGVFFGSKNKFPDNATAHGKIVLLACILGVINVQMVALFFMFTLIK